MGCLVPRAATRQRQLRVRVRKGGGRVLCLEMGS